MLIVLMSIKHKVNTMFFSSHECKSVCSEVQSFHLTTTSGLCSRAAAGSISAAGEEPVNVGGGFRRSGNRTKGQSVRPGLKAHGSRWPGAAEPVYAARLHYSHLLQETQGFLFEPAAKKKPLVPSSRREGDAQTVSPTATRSQNKQLKKMNGGDDRRGAAWWKKVHICLNRMEG